jgi:dipeptidyl-peptidase-4
MNRATLGVLFLLIVLFFRAQEKEKLNIKDIWLYFKFYPRSAESKYVMKDGEHYVEAIDTAERGLWKFSLLNPSAKDRKLLVSANQFQIKGKEIPFHQFKFSPDENVVMFINNTKPIYRYSFECSVHVYNFSKKKLLEIPGGNELMFPEFSPDGKKIAYVRKNNLYVYDLEKEEEIPCTSDGEINKIKNGWGDWVYEEEFSKPDYFCWDASSTRLAYIRFDESQVKNYTLNYYKDSLYPVTYTYKYPKAGEDNSKVSFHVFDITSRKTYNMNTGSNPDIYLPRIFPLQEPKAFCLLRLNRRQNKLEYIFYKNDQPDGKVMLTDSSDTYVDVHDDVFFYKNKGMFFLSERSDYQHIYYLDFATGQIKAITSGNWDVTKCYGVDEKKGILYYQSTENGAHRRDVYSISIDGKNKKLLSPQRGWNEAEFYAGWRYFILNHSDANTPPVYDLYSSDGKKIKTLEDNHKLKEDLKKYDLTKREFLTVKNRTGLELNAWIMKPRNFDSTKKYPVYMFAYNGPGSNEVNDRWESMEYMWHQLLCQQGFIVFCVDGRGTEGRGRKFKHATYLNLGGPESDDQIDAAKYLASLPNVDPKKIMFQGWSYGGFMACLMITKGADVISAAVAVAPVTNWKFYDNIYTERYMRKPSENPDGYEKNSPLYFAKKYKGNLLLIHGDADDNVHVQNSMEFANELIKYGKPFDFFIYPNKNHGIYGGATRLHLFEKILNFAISVRDKKN